MVPQPMVPQPEPVEVVIQSVTTSESGPVFTQNPDVVPVTQTGSFSPDAVPVTTTAPVGPKTNSGDPLIDL